MSAWEDGFYPALLRFPSHAWCGCPEGDPYCANGLPSTCTRTSDELVSGWAQEIGVHEAGHCYYFVDPEYDATCTDKCGHTVMVQGAIASRNRVDFCDYYNAGQNPQCGSHPFPASQSGWSCINATFPNLYPHGWKGAYGPDPFNEVDDRSGAFPVTIVEVNP